MKDKRLFIIMVLLFAILPVFAIGFFRSQKEVAECDAKFPDLETAGLGECLFTGMIPFGVALVICFALLAFALLAMRGESQDL